MIKNLINQTHFLRHKGINAVFIKTISTDKKIFTELMLENGNKKTNFINEGSSRIISLNNYGNQSLLNHNMISSISKHLIEYAKSNMNNLVIFLLDSMEKFCAGADVAKCVQEILNNNHKYALNYFQSSYDLGYLMSTYPKPIVTLINGLTLGGGLGLALSTPFRVATETTKVALPQVNIGFFPDLGTCFFLSRMDDKLGYYFAMTGDYCNGFDSYLAGFATHYVSSEKLPALVRRLSSLRKVSSDEKNPTSFFTHVNRVIDDFSENQPSTNYKHFFNIDDLKTIKNAFSKKSVEKIFEYLEKEQTNFSLNLLSKLKQKPILSLKTIFQHLNNSQTSSIRKQFESDLILTANIINTSNELNEFVKGVKHKIIDQIEDPLHPQWIPSNKINSDFINNLFVCETNLKPFGLINKFFDVDFYEYPYEMGLPKNIDVSNFITGNDQSHRHYLPTREEVIKHFKIQNNNKLGTELKVSQILDLHSEPSEYDEKYISWIN